MEVNHLLESARDIAGLARDLASKTEELRRLPDELVARLRESRLLRLGVPHALGGPEASPAVTLECAETVARGDASAGWCVSINSTASLLSARIPAEGGVEVFGDPGVIAAGVWAPGGKARTVDGGVVVSGRWPYCSAITHSEWLFGGCVIDSDGTPGSGSGGVVGIPKSELEVLDNWHTSGLRGTGSNDTVADEVFVPARRVFSLRDPLAVDAQLYRFPVLGFFALSIGAAALGNARGAIDDLLELAIVKKTPLSGRSIAERTTVQAVVGRCEAALRAARLLFYEAIDEAWRAAEGAEPVSDDLKVGLRLAATHATRTAADVAREMYDLGGGAAIYQESRLQRRFRDAHTATAHFQVNPTTWEVLGRYLLGLDTLTGVL